MNYTNNNKKNNIGGVETYLPRILVDILNSISVGEGAEVFFEEYNGKTDLSKALFHFYNSGRGGKSMSLYILKNEKKWLIIRKK